MKVYNVGAHIKYMSAAIILTGSLAAPFGPKYFMVQDHGNHAHTKIETHVNAFSDMPSKPS